MSASALLSIIAGRDTTGFFEVRCRNPRTGQIEAREWIPVVEQAGCIRFMERRAQKLDVYVGVAPRVRRGGGGRADIRHSWLLYVDADSADAAERVREFTPAPTLIVRSGSGDNVHAYWSLAKPVPPAWFERANRRLAHHLGADIKVTDAARILRPPGTLNHKTEPPVRVTIEHMAKSAEIGVLDVAALVKNLPDPVAKPPARVLRPDVFADDPLLGVSAERYYTALTGRPVGPGNVTCPFHNDGKERNGSLRLYETTWYCFSCAAGGSIYQFGSHLWDIPSRGADFHLLREMLTDALSR